MKNNQLPANVKSELNADLLVLAEQLHLDSCLQSIADILLQYTGPGRCLIFLKERKEWKASLDCTAKGDGILLPSHRKNSIDLETVLNRTVSTDESKIAHSLETVCKTLGENSHNFYAAQIKDKEDTLAIILLETEAALPQSKTQQGAWKYLCKRLPVFLANAIAHNSLEHQNKRLLSEIQEIGHNKQQVINSEKLSSLGRLSASIAHEFGNPLLGIKFLLADLVKSKSVGKRRREMINVALDECNRLQAMIRKLRHEQLPVVQVFFAPISLVDLLKQALQEHQQQLRDNSIAVQTLFTDNDLLVMGTRRQLLQVANNLIRNAVEALKGVKEPILTVCAGTGQDSVFFTIADNGRGMDETVCRKIFEPFFSTKPDVEGAGLGLAVSYWIITGHKGTIMVESTPGKGTTFTVHLPTIPDERYDQSAC